MAPGLPTELASAEHCILVLIPCRECSEPKQQPAPSVACYLRVDTLFCLALRSASGGRVPLDQPMSLTLCSACTLSTEVRFVQRELPALCVCPKVPCRGNSPIQLFIDRFCFETSEVLCAEENVKCLDIIAQTEYLIIPLN